MWPDASLTFPPWTEARRSYAERPAASSSLRGRASHYRAYACHAVRLYHRTMPPCSRPYRALASALPLVASCLASCNERPSAKTPAWLVERGRQEAELAARSHVMHDFRFTDQRQATGITFENRVVDDAARAGLALPDEIGVGCAFADIDNDGDPDLFVTTVRHGNRLFENLGNGEFRDITAQAGVGYVGHSSGVVFFDYDGDGMLDLLVTNVGVNTTDVRGPGGYYVGLTDAFHGHTHPDRTETSILYHNLGGNRFRDVTRDVGLRDLSWSGA